MTDCRAVSVEQDLRETSGGEDPGDGVSVRNRRLGSLAGRLSPRPQGPDIRRVQSWHVPGPGTTQVDGREKTSTTQTGLIRTTQKSYSRVFPRTPLPVRIFPPTLLTDTTLTVEKGSGKSGIITRRRKGGLVAPLVEEQTTTQDRSTGPNPTYYYSDYR